MFYKNNHNLKSLNCTKRLIHKHITRALKYLTRNPSDIHDKFHFWIFMGANQAEFHSSFHFAQKERKYFFLEFPERTCRLGLGWRQAHIGFYGGQLGTFTVIAVEW